VGVVEEKEGGGYQTPLDGAMPRCPEMGGSCGTCGKRVLDNAEVGG